MLLPYDVVERVIVYIGHEREDFQRPNYESQYLDSVMDPYAYNLLRNLCNSTHKYFIKKNPQILEKKLSCIDGANQPNPSRVGRAVKVSGSGRARPGPGHPLPYSHICGLGFVHAKTLGRPALPRLLPYAQGRRSGQGQKIKNDFFSYSTINC